jgi:protoporphyrinogen oxidase
MAVTNSYDVVIIGGGFTGLTAAYVLAKAGRKVALLEADSNPGGLAGTFEFADGIKVEKFYHNWYNNDLNVPELVRELGMEGDVLTLPTNTGMFFNGRLWRLSTPLDLLRFNALSPIDRLRLGLSVLRVRRIRDWRTIEHLSIREWLEPLVGKQVYKVVWEPLITAKFSIHADAVNAVWMWKKLVLRGASRNHKGEEELAYFKGGFGRLAEALVNAIRTMGGEVHFDTKATDVSVNNQTISVIKTSRGQFSGRQYIFTPAFPIIARILQNSSDQDWLASLRRVHYLANICLVLRLNQSLSSTYWLNVNDAGFPFVAVIEHTNFDGPENYRGSHIAFLSRYLAKEDPVWSYSDQKYFEYCLAHLKRMFPKLDRSWVIEFNVWRADYAQPVTERNYSHYVPGRTTRFKNGHICTMAQIYPEDRGTNYAIREGRKIAAEVESRLAAEA